MAIPFGKLGDRLGRRKILILALIGVAVSLAEIFFVCGVHSSYMRHEMLSLLRRISQPVSNPVGMAVFPIPAVRRWVEFRFRVYVGNGISVHSVR